MSKPLIPQIRFKGYTDEWQSDNIGNATRSYSGGTPTAGCADYYGGSIPFIRSGEIHGNSTELFLTDEGLAKSSAAIVSKGTILYALYGATSGEVAISQINGAINQAILAIIPNDDYDSYCLSYWLHQNKSPIINTYLQGGQGNLSGVIVKSIDFNLPRISEQREIGEFFKQFDKLIAEAGREVERLEKMKLASLQKMFPRHGASTPEIRFAGFSEPWKTKRLGEIMNVGSVKRIHQEDWSDTGVRFLRARDIVAALKGEEIDDKLYINPKLYEEFSAISGKVVVGDLLVTGVGTIGVPYLIKDKDPIYFKDGNIIWFKNSNLLDGSFFFYSFIAAPIQDFILKSSTVGTVGTYTIESGKSTPISVPSFAEQKVIGEYFRNLDDLIAAKRKYIVKLHNIKKSCLDKMFVNTSDL